MSARYRLGSPVGRALARQARVPRFDSWPEHFQLCWVKNQLYYYNIEDNLSTFNNPSLQYDIIKNWKYTSHGILSISTYARQILNSLFSSISSLILSLKSDFWLFKGVNNALINICI